MGTANEAAGGAQNAPTSSGTPYAAVEVGRKRRVFVIALARKLPAALRRYAATGAAPDGAALA